MHTEHANYYQHTSTRAAHVQHTCWARGYCATLHTQHTGVTHTSLMVGVLRVQVAHSGVLIGRTCKKLQGVSQ